MDRDNGRPLAVAYRYLNRRERTESEVRRHLEQHDVSAEDIEDAIQTLREQRYLDDARFVQLFVEDKRTIEQWGDVRIRRSLQQRGVSTALLDDLLAGEAREDELARALEVLADRFSAPPRTRRERDQALGVLVRKGYDPELALDALAAHSRAQAG